MAYVFEQELVFDVPKSATEDSFKTILSLVEMERQNIHRHYSVTEVSVMDEFDQTNFLADQNHCKFVESSLHTNSTPLKHEMTENPGQFVSDSDALFLAQESYFNLDNTSTR